MDTNAWATHVTLVSMAAVKDPSRLQKALQLVFTTWLVVLAVLKFQFAKTVSLCLAVAEMLEMPACQVLGPALAIALGPDLNHWLGVESQELILINNWNLKSEIVSNSARQCLTCLIWFGK